MKQLQRKNDVTTNRQTNRNAITDIKNVFDTTNLMRYQHA